MQASTWSRLEHTSASIIKQTTHSSPSTDEYVGNYTYTYYSIIEHQTIVKLK